MSNEHIEHERKLHMEIWELGKELSQWYDIDKVKFDSVYIWTNANDDTDMNVFDIGVDEIYYYVNDHVIPDEAWPGIRKIQAKLREIQNYVYNNADAFPNGRWLKARQDKE